MSKQPPLTGEKRFRNDVVRLADLTVNTFILDGYEFSNCKILGPAILVPQGRTSIVECGWEGDLDAIFWEIGADRQLVIGAIAIVDCTFSNCTFSQIGLAGPPELRDMMEGSLRPGD